MASTTFRIPYALRILLLRDIMEAILMRIWFIQWITVTSRWVTRRLILLKQVSRCRLIHLEVVVSIGIRGIGTKTLDPACIQWWTPPDYAQYFVWNTPTDKCRASMCQFQVPYIRLPWPLSKVFRPPPCNTHCRLSYLTLHHPKGAVSAVFQDGSEIRGR